MRTRTLCTLTTTLALATLLIPASLLAVPAGAEAAPALEVLTRADQLTFAPAGAWQGLRLEWAAPDGRVFEQSVEEGTLSLAPADPEGEPLPAGVYAYELWGGSDTGDVLLRSGFFSIRDGSFVSPDVAEERPGGLTAITAPASIQAAQTINDDLVVRNSVCIGFDCLDNETFGSYSLMFKENNNRIFFNDTSSSGAFPANDWSLVVNDSANGGASYFSLVNCTRSPGSCASGTGPFTVLASAPDNALFVGTQGRVGLGTSVPATEIHVRDGNTPALRLEQDTSAGFASQTWDVSGNETGFFVRDATNGFQVPLRILPGAAENSIYVGASGDVGLGTDTPSGRLDVAGSIAVAGTVDGRDVAADGATLDAHVADLANPHQVTAAQAGADPAGTAAAQVTAHEAAFDHGNIPSALPVPVAEGGTGATDAATARANLGIEDDPSKAGIVPAASFGGLPAATATVTFAQPFPAGTRYVVLLTAVTSDANKLTTPNVVTQSASGFTMTLGGPVKDLVEVGWLARPVTE